MAKRWVRKDRRIYDFSLCDLCGTAGGTTGRCNRSICMACGSAQCSSNGLARGTCGICFIGLLPGWSGNNRKCSYKGCNNQAIARVDGQNSLRCREHLERGKWAGYIARRLAERNLAWIEIEE